MNRDTYIVLTIAFLATIFVLFQKKAPAPKVEDSPVGNNKPPLTVLYGTPTIDGQDQDDLWSYCEWQPINQVWMGVGLTPQDFSGRYKIAWDENNLYIVAEIEDDALVDTHPDGLLKYWDDDCLEIFIDEDASGGIHQYNYNAFAYHIALDGKVVDIAPDSSFRYYNDHCMVKRTTTGTKSIWEVAMKIYDGNRYSDTGENIAKSLKMGKKMGFMIAYCDNDHSPEREHFIGNIPMEGTEKNRGWIDASVFGTVVLSD